MQKKRDQGRSVASKKVDQPSLPVTESSQEKKILSWLQQQQKPETKGSGNDNISNNNINNNNNSLQAAKVELRYYQQQPKASPVILEDSRTDEIKPTHRVEEHSALDSKIRTLIEIISHDKDHAIYPYIDYENNKITFPVLAKIGESEDNIGLLEKLASESIGVLERQIFERLVLCPEHSESYAISLRLYCGKCGSIDVEKLHLIEHKACGYIGKKSEFEASALPKCPSCRITIKDSKKELRIPGMWYECNDCSSKFDNPTIKLHCRKYNHDFNMNQAETLVIPYFKLRKHATTAQVNILSVIPMLKKVLAVRDFAVEETPKIKGKSGVIHTASLYAYNRENKTILVDVRSSDKQVDDAEVVSTFVKVIDVSPSFAIFVAIPDLSEKAKAMSAACGNIHIVTGSSFADIVRSVEQILAKQLADSTVPNNTVTTEDLTFQQKEAAATSTGGSALGHSHVQTGPRRID